MRVQALIGIIYLSLRLSADSAPLPPTNYHHTAWTSENGVGAVYDIQQAPNGYLWLTTSKGVFRFDGVAFRSIEEVTNGAAKTRNINAVYLSPSGAVWLSTQSAGLLLWKGGKLTTFTDRRCTPSLKSGSVSEDQDGWLWVQGQAGLYRTNGPVCEAIDSKWGYPGGFVPAVLADRQGTVWVKTEDGPVLVLPRGASRFERSKKRDGPTVHPGLFHQAPDGSMWFLDDLGLRCITCDGSRAPVLPQPARAGYDWSADFSFAADSSIWMVTNDGLQHFDRSGMLLDSVFGVQQGLSSNAVRKILVDAEGSVWVGTNSGLDRLRRNALRVVALPQTQEGQFAVATGNDGSVWTGNANLPLTQVFPDGRTVKFTQTAGTYVVRRDPEGQIWSAGALHLWHTSASGLTRLHYPREQTDDVVSIAVDRNREAWISTIQQNVHRLAHGVWTNQNQALGRRPGVLGAMRSDDEGNVWFAFSRSVVKWDGSQYQKYSFLDPAMDISVTTIDVRGEHVWLGGGGGILLFTGGAFHLLKWKDAEGPGRVSGVLETAEGDLWVNGFSGVTHISSVELKKWLQDPNHEVVSERLDALDGLPGLSADRIPEPSIVEARDGRLWMATTKGVCWLDPKTFAAERNRVPPPVAIESLYANGRAYPTLGDLRLPPSAKTIEIHYAALSMAMPERVLFRYRLDGADEGWQDAGTRRQAFYTNLLPGQYQFRVIASNNDGVWNETGASWVFSIAPTFYETLWFKTLMALAGIGLIWLLYRLRLRQITARADLRYAERLEERTRIARELHDTLLQSFHGLIFRFQAVDNMLPARPSEAKQTLESALDNAAEAITEARDAVHELRSSTLVTNDLAAAVKALGEELATHQATSAASQDSPTFVVEVEGTPPELHPILRDEVCRIAGESLRNAFRHARARRIEVEIRYDERELRVRIRDDGSGIDTSVLGHEGRAGHWGLRGMRERAERIGGTMDLWSELGAGTEVELRIPASIAYQTYAGRGFRLFRRKKGTPLKAASE